jgi:hypothetical protein
MHSLKIEALFVSFNVYLCNVQEEKIPAIWLLFFPHGYTSHGGDCYVLVDKTHSFIFHWNTTLFLLASNFMNSRRRLFTFRSRQSVDTSNRKRNLCCARVVSANGYHSKAEPYFRFTLCWTFWIPAPSLCYNFPRSQLTVPTMCIVSARLTWLPLPSFPFFLGG